MHIKNMITSIFILLMLAASLLVLLAGVRASTPNIVQFDNTEESESIALLEPVDINGQVQWLLIRGVDRSNPVLLWLHGGPGSPQMPFSHYLDQKLEKNYVVVHWDQRGAGKSNSSDFNENTMSSEKPFFSISWKKASPANAGSESSYIFFNNPAIYRYFNLYGSSFNLMR